MVRFYDPVDRKDLVRIERILSSAGIEYSVAPARVGSGFPGSIGIAEEDLPRAVELLGAPPGYTQH